MSTDFSPTPVFYIIIGFLFGLILGWAAGFFDSNSRSDKKIKAAENNADIAIREAEKKIEEANQKISESPKIQDDPGLLRLKNNGGTYGLEMDGAPVAGVLTPDGKKRLIELLTVIRPYLEGGLPPQAPLQPAAPRPNSAPQPVQVAPAPVFPTPKLAAPVKVVPKTEQEKKEQEEKEKQVAALGMVGQIDSILQTHLLGSPLAQAGIRLKESPEGGVEVEVGLETFPGVEEVPYPEVKAAIRSAITEWEKKFTPGM